METGGTVRPDDILKELSAYWRNLGAHGGPDAGVSSGTGADGDAATEGTPDGGGLLRACSMTLI
jgi:hypothetical protein